jgi:hypothetical protein
MSFFNNPLASYHTTGNSRADLTPETCSAFKARLSPTYTCHFFGSNLGN